MILGRSKTVFDAVGNLRQREGLKPVVLFRISFEIYRDLAILIGEHYKEIPDINWLAFEHTKHGPVLALWLKGELSERDVFAGLGAYSIN